MRKVFVVTCVLVSVGVARTVSAQGTNGVLTSTDVGSVGIAGSARWVSGVLEVSGSGADIWGDADAFQFAHAAVGRGGAAFACVRDLQNTNPFAKAGLMIRSSLDASAA